jgi:hypothetical protein
MVDEKTGGPEAAPILVKFDPMVVFALFKLFIP